MILETPYEMAISVAERYRNIRKAKKITLKVSQKEAAFRILRFAVLKARGKFLFLLL